MEEDSELLELPPEAGVTGVRVARDPQGLYVTQAPKGLRLQQGDRLLGARVIFEGVAAEDAEKVLESARTCKVSLCLRRRKRGDLAPQATQGKVARLRIPILTPSKKPPASPIVVTAAPGGPSALALAFPKLSDLVKNRSGSPATPNATSSRLLVKEAAAAKTPWMEELPARAEGPRDVAEKLEGPGVRFPTVELVAPKIPAGLSFAAAAPGAKEPASRLPQLEVAVPALPEPGKGVKQPQAKVGDGEAAVGRRQSAGSPVLKAKLPAWFGTGSVPEDADADATRGAFAGIRMPSLGIAAPGAALELGVARAEAPPAAPSRLTFDLAVPAIAIAVPPVAVDLALPAGVAASAPDGASGFAKGLRELSQEPELAGRLPVVEIATPARLTPAAKPKPPKFTLPRFGSALAKLRMSSDGDGYPQPPPGNARPRATLDRALATVGGAGAKLKVPKLSLVPFEGPRASAVKPATGGSKGDDGRDPGSPRLRVPRVGLVLPAPGFRRAPSLPKLPTVPELGRGVKLPKFGGSSPELRPGGAPGVLRRGGSAESLSVAAVARKTLASPGMMRSKLKAKGVTGEGVTQGWPPRFSFPIIVGFTAPDEPAKRKMPKAVSVLKKVPALELVPPGMVGGEEAPKTEAPKVAGVKKERGEAKPGGVGPPPHSAGDAKTRRWVPRVGFGPPEPPQARPKAGKSRLPDVSDTNLALGAMEMPPALARGALGGGDPPKFQLPKVALSPQVCGE